jgi:hypothetical protein
MTEEWTPLSAQDSFNNGKAYSQANYGHFATSREESSHLEGGGFFDTFRPLIYFRNSHPSVRSQKRHRLNIIFGTLLALTTLMLLGIGGLLAYKLYVVPYQAAKALDAAIRSHAEAAAQRVEKCRGIDWKRACDNLGAAGARRSLFEAEEETYDAFEDYLLHSDDPSVTYDDNCLRVYRLDLDDDITFPYHSSQFLKAGGNQTMALFIQVSEFGCPCSTCLGLYISHACV